jgi:amidase
MQRVEDVVLSDATDQLAALVSGRVSAQELLAAVLERVDRLDPQINAVIARDTDRAMAEARGVDNARSRGEPLGPLAGLPMTVKDTFDIEGLPASAGMKSLLDRVTNDAEAVARVRKAGAVVWGHTNVPVGASDWQAFNPLYGVTRNPWDAARTPGGSSGGSAAALAAGFTALEIGADIGGSLRIPAGYCGVTCHRPSWGLISQRGIVPPPGFMADFDLVVVGPMARSARDLQLLLSVLADVPAAPAPSLSDLRVGLWLDEPLFPIDPAVRAVIAGFAGGLQAGGAGVEAIKSPLPPRPMLETYITLLMSVLGGFLGPTERAVFEILRWPAKLAEVLGAGPLSWAHGVLGYTARHSEWLAANEARACMTAVVASVFDRFDILLAPVTPTTAFVHDHSPLLAARRITTSDGRRLPYLENFDWIALATLCDLPATVICAGHTAEGLPVGVQIIGPPGADAATLSAAVALEAKAGGFRSPVG